MTVGLKCFLHSRCTPGYPNLRDSYLLCVTTTTGKQPARLKVRSIRRLTITVFLLAALLFSSAGTLRFWQAWLFVGLQAGLWVFFFVDFLRNNPQLVERRLQSKENQPEQRWFQRLWTAITIPGFLLIGWDFRFGWTRHWLGAVPVVVVLVAQAAVVAGYWLVFWVMKTNTFAASTIRMETGQRVIEGGPYALTRHPMYTGMLVTMLAVPVALGSYVTVPIFALLVPTLIFRLIHEERTLRRELPGYAEYCERTRYRLVPRVW
jgi:protein-S-isoprenylcysteine O-methyltransferase Ste14